MSRAQLSLLGALWHHPEMAYTPSGRAITAFPVVVFQREGDIERPIVCYCVVWGDQAEQANDQVLEMYETGARHLLSVQGECYSFEYAWHKRAPLDEFCMLFVEQFHIVERWQEELAPHATELVKLTCLLFLIVNQCKFPLI
jgi:hypothetical protein